MSRQLPRTLLLLAACHTSKPTDDTDSVDTDTPDAVADTDVAVETDEPVDTDDTDAPTCTFALAEATAGDPLVFTTSGCWTVTVANFTITVADTLGTIFPTVQMWGDPHENLNGKHVKDWETARRTLLIPGGVILTMDAAGPTGVVTKTTLYDGAHARTVDNDTNAITASVDDATLVAAQEAAEADGETARITALPDEAIRFDNEYTQGEDQEGTPLAKEPNVKPIGETGGTANPNQVNDYYP